MLLASSGASGFYKGVPDGAVEIGNNCWYSILSEEDKTAVFCGMDACFGPGFIEEFDIPAYVKFPDRDEKSEYTVVEIGEEAFSIHYNCIPQYYQFDYSGGYEDCMVGKVTLPETVTKIGAGAFSGAHADGFSEFRFPESVTDIGIECFYRASGVERIYLPKGLKVIPSSFAYMCKYLKECDIPAGVESIGACAFYRCHAMERVYIPASVKLIGTDAFTALVKIDAFEVDPANEYYSSPDGILLDKEGKTLIAWPFARSADVVIPEGVETMFGCPLNHAYHLFSSIDLPSTMKSLPEGSFRYNTHLKKIIVRAEVPPICEGDEENPLFDDLGSYGNIKLYVPAGSVEAYRAAPVWKEFRNILAIGSDAVEGISDDPDATEAEYFTLGGMKTDEPAHGEITVRRQNGKAILLRR